MDTNRAVKHCLGCTRTQGHGKTLHDFTRVRADHVQAHHAVGGIFHHQFHERAFAAAAQRVFQCFEFAAENGDGTKFLAGVSLAVTHRADGRVGEYGGGDKFIVHAALASAKQRVHHHHGLGQGHWGQLHPRGHVAQGVDGRHRGLVLRVDGDGTALALFHTGRFQPDVPHMGCTAGSVEHGIGLEYGA